MRISNVIRKSYYLKFIFTIVCLFTVVFFGGRSVISAPVTWFPFLNSCLAGVRMICFGCSITDMQLLYCPAPSPCLSRALYGGDDWAAAGVLHNVPGRVSLSHLHDLRRRRTPTSYAYARTFSFFPAVRNRAAKSNLFVFGSELIRFDQQCIMPANFCVSFFL